MMRAHAGDRGKNHGSHRRAEREMQHVLGRQPLRREYQHEQWHHHYSTADAEKPCGKAHQRADAEVGDPSRHAPSTWAATSANPAPELARVMYFGGIAMTAAKRRTFATPTEWSKNSNIGASLGESPA